MQNISLSLLPCGWSVSSAETREPVMRSSLPSGKQFRTWKYFFFFFFWKGCNLQAWQGQKFWFPEEEIKPKKNSNLLFLFWILNESFSKNFSVILKKKILGRRNIFLKRQSVFFGGEMCSCFSNANFSFDVLTTIFEWVFKHLKM